MGTNQGEGNRDADRRYREGVRKGVESRDLEKAADAAKQAREDPDSRRELDEAERRAQGDGSKQGDAPPPVQPPTQPGSGD